MKNLVMTTLAAAMMVTGVVSLAGSPASAATSKSTCSDEYQAAKAAGTLNGQKWPQFLSTCAASLKAGAAATPAATTTAKVKGGTTGAMAPTSGASAAIAAPSARAANAGAPTGAPTEKQLQAHARIKECGVEWKQAKSDGTLTPGQKWPQYWSACNTRLKTQG